MTIDCYQCGTTIRREHSQDVPGTDVRVCSHKCGLEWTLRNDPPADPIELLDLIDEAGTELDEAPLARVVIVTGEFVGNIVHGDDLGWDMENGDGDEFFVSRTERIAEAEAVFA